LSSLLHQSSTLPYKFAICILQSPRIRPRTQSPCVRASLPPVSCVLAPFTGCYCHPPSAYFSFILHPSPCLPLPVPSLSRFFVFYGDFRGFFSRRRSVCTSAGSVRSASRMASVSIALAAGRAYRRLSLRERTPHVSRHPQPNFWALGDHEMQRGNWSISPGVLWPRKVSSIEFRACRTPCMGWRVLRGTIAAPCLWHLSNCLFIVHI
jgi:hypothetical protein